MLGVARVIGVMSAGALMGALALSLWVLATAPGTRWALRTLADTGLLALHAEAIEGRLLGPLALRGLRLDLPGLRIEADSLRLEWAPAALLARQFSLRAVQAGEVRVHLLPTPPPSSPRAAPRIPQLPIALDLAQLDVARLEVWAVQAETPQVFSDVRVQALRWAGHEVSLHEARLTHADSGTLIARVRAKLHPRHVEIETLDLRDTATPPLHVSLTGRLHLDEVPSALDLRWRDLRWPLQDAPQITSREGRVRVDGVLARDLRFDGAFALGERAQLQARGRYANQALDARLDWTALGWPLHGAPRIQSAQGHVEVRGTPQDYRYLLDAQLSAENRAGSAQAKGRGGARQVQVETLRIQAARSELRGQGTVDWSQALRADLDLELRNLDPGLIHPAWPGRLNGRVQARTQMRNGQPQARFELALRDSQLRGYPLRLDSVGEVRGDRSVQLARFELRSGATQVQASGQVTPPFDVRVRLDSPDLRALWPGLGGRAQLQAQARGTLEQPHAMLRGHVDALDYDALRIARVQLDADVALAGAWRLDLRARGLEGPVARSDLSLDVDGTAGQHVLRAQLDGEAGGAQVELSGRYDIPARQWQGALRRGALQPPRLAAWTLEEPAALWIGRARQRLDPACWRAQTSRACVQLTHEAGRLRAATRLDRFDFAYVAAFLPRQWTLSGGIDGTALAEVRDGRLAEAHADLRTEPIALTREGQDLLRTRAGLLRIDEVQQAVQVELDLPLENGHVRLDAHLDAGVADYRARPLRATLDLRLDDLAPLRLASEEISAIDGRLLGRIEWRGSLGAPQPSGEIRLLDGALKLRTPGLDLAQVQMRLGSGAGEAPRLQASAQSGGGSLEVDGRVQPFGETPGAQLQIRGADFQAANTAEARVWVSPRLELDVDPALIAVRGEIDVPRAQITPVSFEGGVAPTRDQVIVRGDAEPGAARGMRVSADVRVNLGEKVSFDGFGLKARLSGAVRVVEAPGRPGVGYGEVRVVEGRYKAYGQDLDIQTGRLLFNGGPLTAPAVEVRALRKPTEAIEVGVLVRGQLDRPDFQLFSTPAMPRDQQLSWLVLGRPAGSGGSDERSMLANAALSLGLSGTDFLAQNLRGGLRLDDISIGADPGDDAQQARFTVGKYLSSKLYVSYGVGLFQPGQVFKLLYDLGRGFRFSTESGVHTGGDLLYSIERK